VVFIQTVIVLVEFARVTALLLIHVKGKTALKVANIQIALVSMVSVLVNVLLILVVNAQNAKTALMESVSRRPVRVDAPNAILVNVENAKHLIHVYHLLVVTSAYAIL
jgi:hypothetical protein